MNSITKSKLWQILVHCVRGYKIIKKIILNHNCGKKWMYVGAFLESLSIFFSRNFTFYKWCVTKVAHCIPNRVANARIFPLSTRSSLWHQTHYCDRIYTPVSIQEKQVFWLNFIQGIFFHSLHLCIDLPFFLPFTLNTAKTKPYKEWELESRGNQPSGQTVET